MLSPPWLFETASNYRSPQKSISCITPVWAGRNHIKQSFQKANTRRISHQRTGCLEGTAAGWCRRRQNTTCTSTSVDTRAAFAFNSRRNDGTHWSVRAESARDNRRLFLIKTRIWGGGRQLGALARHSGWSILNTSHLAGLSSFTAAAPSYDVSLDLKKTKNGILTRFDQKTREITFFNYYC